MCGITRTGHTPIPHPTLPFLDGSKCGRSIAVLVEAASTSNAAFGHH